MTIKINFFLFSIVAKVLFAFLVLFDSLLIARVAGEFATNGIRGVQGWILHAGSVRKITAESSGPGLITVQFPPSGPIFREFSVMCGVLLVLTPLSYWVGSFFAEKARQAK